MNTPFGDDIIKLVNGRRIVVIDNVYATFRGKVFSGKISEEGHKKKVYLEEQSKKPLFFKSLGDFEYDDDSAGDSGNE